jgi:hypothetical protein
MHVTECAWGRGRNRGKNTRRMDNSVYVLYMNYYLVLEEGKITRRSYTRLQEGKRNGSRNINLRSGEWPH